MVRKPVLIEWHDAHALTEGWTPVADIETEARLIYSCGFLIPSIDKPGHHVLVQSVDEDHVDNALAIPDAMIVRVVDLL